MEEKDTFVSPDPHLSTCIWKIRGEVLVKTEIETKKIKNVEDSDKPVVVFSTNCDFFSLLFSFDLASFQSQS